MSIWEDVGAVKTPLALVAGGITVLLFAWRAYLSHLQKLLKSAPAKDRAKLIVDILSKAGIDPNTIPEKERFKVAQLEFGYRNAREKRWLLGLGYISTLVFAFALAALLLAPKGDGSSVRAMGQGPATASALAAAAPTTSNPAASMAGTPPSQVTAASSPLLAPATRRVGQDSPHIEISAIVLKASFEEAELGTVTSPTVHLQSIGDFDDAPQIWAGGHSGDKSLNFIPSGNPATTNGKRISGAQSLFIDVAKFQMVRVEFWYLSTSNPRTSTIHNCDSALEFDASKDDAASWKGFTRICGENPADGPTTWHKSAININTAGTSRLSLRFTYYLQNSEAANPGAKFLIDDLLVTGYYASSDAPL